VIRSILLGLAMLVAAAPAPAAPPGRNIEFLANVNEYPQPPGSYGYASCWGYVHGDGREYAVIGCATGTAIYNVTDPLNPYRVGFIDGPPSIWREMKSYRNWIYVVTEGLDAGRGLQIIRMTDPENPVLANTYTATVQSAHTVSVDTTRALLYCNGTKYWAGGTSFPANGVRILSLVDPENPVEVGWWPGGSLPVSSANYVHDGVPIGNRYYASSIYVGTQRILDVTNPATPTQSSAFSYAGAFYTHNAWPDATGNWLYVTDEQNGQTLRVFDIADLGSVKLANAITPNPSAIVHNAHVIGGDLHLANYTEGVRVCDITDPAHPAEFAWMDTYEGPSGGFNGVWGVYPFFPSGTIIASDMTSGLYLYRVQRDYGIVQVTVHDGSTATGDACGVDGACCCGEGVCTCDHASMAVAPGIEVFLTTQGDSLVTPADGIVRFAPGPGTHTVVARKFGYFDATATLEVTAGGVHDVQLALVPKPTVAFGGAITDAVSSLPLETAEVNLLYTALHGHSDASGFYSLGSVPQDLYRVEVRAPGHVALSYDRFIGPGLGGEDYQLPPATTWDALESANGWTTGAPGDNATSGLWVRVEPLGTGLAGLGMIAAGHKPRAGEAGLVIERPGPGLFHDGHEEESAIPGDVQPEFDRSPPPGSMCFITGQGTDPSSIGQQDVDGGRTSLTTAPFDLSAMNDPVLAYWRWFYGDGGENDWLATFISNNGTTWVPVDTLRGVQNHWREKTVRVSDFVTPGPQVQLRFVAADLGAGSIVEAGIDDLSIYDDQPVTDVPAPNRPVRLALRAPAPNPSSGWVELAVELPAPGMADVEVLDLAGRALRALHRGDAPAGMLALAWDGLDGRGRPVPAGLYFVRVRAAGAVALARLVRVP
jgi:choice-of-anchor B domain-containing protein